MNKSNLLFGIVMIVLGLLSVNAQASISVEGGTITGMSIAVDELTSTWQGYFGFVDLANFYNIPVNWFNTTNQSNAVNFTPGSILAEQQGHVGYLFVVNGTDSQVNVNGSLQPGIIADLDSAITPSYDKPSLFFTDNSTFNISGENSFTVNDVPTTYLFNGSNANSTDFREGFMVDSITGNHVFVVDLYYDTKSGYNTSQVAYQYIVPNINDGYSVFVYLENTRPQISFTSPLGNESWSGTQFVQWNALDIDGDTLNYTLELFNSSNSMWEIVNSSISDTTSFEWTIPPVASDLNNVQLRLNVTDGDLLNSIISNNFTIVSTDIIAPIISILHPNATITYIVNSIPLNVSTNENANTCYYNIGGSDVFLSGANNDFSANLDVTNQDTLFNLQVTCNDTAGNVGNSNLIFKVDNIIPTVGFDFPEDNDNLTGNITLDSSVIDADVQNITFEFNNGTWNTIGTNNTNPNGTNFKFTWDTSSIHAQGIQLRATATDDAGLANTTLITGIEIDNMQPSQIADLQSSIGSEEGELDLSWTAPGEDSTQGTLTSYQVRYSTLQINDSNWASASLYGQPIIPQQNGTSETLTLTGLPNSTELYVAVRGIDNVGLIGDLSNIAFNQTRHHNLTATQIDAQSLNSINETVSINVSIQNNGNIAENSTVNFYVDNIFNTSQSITDIQPGQTINKTFNWFASKEGSNIPLTFEVIPVTYETGIADNNITQAIDILAVHDVSVDGFAHDKQDTTIFKFDTVNFTANISNNGQVEEVVQLSLHNGVTILQNVTIPAFTTIPVSFEWNATSEGLVYLTASIAATESNYGNNELSEYLNVYSIKDTVNLTWFDASSYPAATETGNFFVSPYVVNLNTITDYTGIPARIEIDGLQTGFNVVSTRVGDLATQTLVNVTKDNQYYPYWEIDHSSLSTGIHNITIVAGNSTEDRVEISRLVDIQ